MVQMRKISRLGVQPGLVIAIERADERERAPELVDYLLVVPMLAFHALGAPAPTRWQLPVGEVRRQLVRDAVAKWTIGRRHIYL